MIETYRKKLTPLLAEFHHAEKEIETEQNNLEAAIERLANVEQAQKLVQQVAEHTQEEVHKQIASVVSRCLETVFEIPYEFKILFTQKRGKTEAELVFVRNGKTVDPTTAAGGGVIDVASFALRLACLILDRPKKRRLLIADEPFRFLDKTRRPAMKGLLETLCEEMKLQIIMVTHSEDFMIGKVVEL